MKDEELQAAIDRAVGQAVDRTAEKLVKLLETTQNRARSTIPNGTPPPISAEEVKKKADETGKALAQRDNQIVTHVQGMEQRLGNYIRDSVAFLDQRIRQIEEKPIPVPANDAIEKIDKQKDEIEKTRRTAFVAIWAPCLVTVITAIANRVPSETATPPAPTAVAVPVLVPTALPTSAPSRVEVQVTPPVSSSPIRLDGGHD